MKLLEVQPPRQSEYKAGHSDYKIDQMLAHLYSAGGQENAWKLMYFWARQNKLTVLEFVELAKQYSRE